MPMLEEMPREEKVRRANVILRTRPRDAEETLLRLINDEDQVVAATAIDVARQQKIWSLADDIEHVLAHRDVRDWYVFEAASWALAEHRMPAERRRELWLEPLPAAELAGRLRHLPLFASVTVDELFRIAGAARQVRHEPGTVLLQEGSVPATIHLLLDGHVSATARNMTPRTIDPPSALGFAEALQGQPMPETIRTAEVAVTLALTTEELRTLLSDNADLVTGLFATLAESGASPDSHSPVHPTGAATELQQIATGGLSPIDKVLALQRVPIFARVSADEMRYLANIAVAVEMGDGRPVPGIRAASALAHAVRRGLARRHATAQASAGDVIGSVDTMAGRSARSLRLGTQGRRRAENRSRRALRHARRASGAPSSDVCRDVQDQAGGAGSVRGSGGSDRGFTRRFTTRVQDEGSHGGRAIGSRASSTWRPGWRHASGVARRRLARCRSSDPRQPLRRSRSAPRPCGRSSGSGVRATSGPAGRRAESDLRSGSG